MARLHEAHSRHARYYLHLCIQSSPSRPIASSSIHNAIENIRKAYDWTAQNFSNDDEIRDLFCRFPLAIGIEAYKGFSRYELINWMKSGLAESAFIAGSQQLKYQLEYSQNLGFLLYETGELKDSLQHYMMALELAVKIHESQAEGRILGMLGQVHSQLGDIDASVEFLKKSLLLMHKLDDAAGEAACLAMLGNNCLALGRNREAVQFFVQCWNSVGDIANQQQLEISALAGVGSAYDNSGEYLLAIPCYKEALSRARELGDRSREAQLSGALGGAYLSSGDLQNALTLQKTSLNLAQQCEDEISAARALSGLGACYFFLTQYEEAQNYQQEACKKSEALGDRLGEATALSALSMTFHQIGMRSQATATMQKALTLFDEISSPLAEPCRRMLSEWRTEEMRDDACVLNLSSKNPSAFIAQLWNSIQRDYLIRYLRATSGVYQHFMSPEWKLDG